MIEALEPAALAAYPLPRLPVDGDKENRGAVLVVGGATDMAGAAMLAGLAALRVGAGKLQIRGDRDAAASMAVGFPEARIIVSPEGKVLGKPLRSAARSSSALVIGPGMESGSQQRKLARRLLEAAVDVPAVIDAGGVPDQGSAAVFAGLAGGRVVLTPHAGEMAGMLGRDKTSIKANPLGAARDASSLFRSVVVMKGAVTFIVSPDGMAWRHDGGVTGLGTSGSGDVLAGAIGGLLARGAPPIVAALWGVCLHAEAGTTLAAHGPLGFLARELPGEFPGLLGRWSVAGENSPGA